MWNAKQCRAYKRINSGFTIASQKRESVRFITLTSAVGMRRLSKDFNVLVKRIRRQYGGFEYLRVTTNEGNGVIHALCRGSYIPQPWLSKNWGDIHKSPVVDIRMVRPYKGLASYVVSQYVANQGSSYQRCSSSWSWIYRGWCQTWETIRHGIKEKIAQKEAWESHLKGFMVKISDRGVVRFLSPYPMLNTMSTEQTFIDAGVFLASSDSLSSHYESLLARCEWIK